jgi:hypothetical protein
VRLSARDWKDRRPAPERFEEGVGLPTGRKAH